jgi:hypothetical protein
MGYRRRSRRDEGVLGDIVGLAMDGISSARDASPLAGVGIGIGLAVALCVLVPGILSFFSSNGSPISMVIFRIMGMLSGFCRFVGAIGGLVCVGIAGSNLVRHWQRESYPGAQLVLVIGVGLSFLAYINTLIPSETSQPLTAGLSFITAPVHPAQSVTLGALPAPTSLTEAVQQAPARALANMGASLAGSSQPATAHINPSPMFAADVYMVESKYLGPQGFKVVREGRCETFVDFVLAASRSVGTDPASRSLATARVADALKQGTEAQCFVPKTTEEALPVALRQYWESSAQRLLQTSRCVQYATWARELVFAHATEDERRYQLTRLFADAQEHDCLR